jgi:hypothetical protein
LTLLSSWSILLIDKARKANRRVDMTRKEISEQYEGQNVYFRGVDNLDDIVKPSIDIIDKENVDFVGGKEGIENILMNNNLDSWYIETLEDESIKITYEGVNALTNYQDWIHDQYDFFAVIKGDCLGDNFMSDGDIVRVNEIIAVFNKEGNCIK